MARPVEDFVVDSGLKLVPTYGGGCGEREGKNTEPHRPPLDSRGVDSLKPGQSSYH